MAHKVVMFVLNNFTRDTRVFKEARTLVAAGYEVTVYALLDASTKPQEVIQGIRVVRLLFATRLKYLIAAYRKLVEVPLVFLLRKVGLLPVPQNPSPRAAAKGQRSNSSKDRSETLVEDKEKLLPLQQSYRRLRAWAIHYVNNLRFSQFYRRCYRRLRNDPADIYHAHDLNTLPIACLAGRKLGGRVVYDSHELYTESGVMTRSQQNHWTKLEKELIHQADAVLVVCESIGRELSQRYGVPMPTVLRNCCELCPRRPEKDLIREKLGLSSDVPIVLYQGGFSAGRGLLHLVQAAQYIDEAVIVFMGWGQLENELKAAVRRQGLNERVHFIPPAPLHELLWWSASADVGVIPYRAVRLNNYYSCPNKLFEYINAGAAVAASEFPELKNIVETYRVGRTFDPEDPRSIGTTINAMLKDRDTLAEFRKNAREAAKTLNWRVESEKLLHVYRRILAGDPTFT